MYKVFVPVLLAEKVLVLLVPKSVLFKVEGEVAPGLIVLLFPLRLSVADGVEVVVNPLATPPGLTQLDALPAMAKLVSVPVLAPAASINSVCVALAPDGIPWLK